MGSITLNFTKDLNASLQAGTGLGDIIFYKDISAGTVIKVGECTAITANTLTCTIADDTARPVAGDFIFFAKDSEINTSGIIGYYAEVTFEITSSSFKELFAVNTEVFISS